MHRHSVLYGLYEKEDAEMKTNEKSGLVLLHSQGAFLLEVAGASWPSQPSSSFCLFEGIQNLCCLLCCCSVLKCVNPHVLGWNVCLNCGKAPSLFYLHFARWECKALLALRVAHMAGIFETADVPASVVAQRSITERTVLRESVSVRLPRVVRLAQFLLCLG